MSKVYNLSFILDKDGYNSINLISFYKLSDLDKYINKYFKNTNDVRKRFDTEIGEMCLDNMEFIQEENRENNRNWTGSIVIIEDEVNNDDVVTSFNKMSVLYQDDNKLLPRNACIKKIKEMLCNDVVLFEIMSNKRFLLSQNEFDLLNIYRKTHNSKFKIDAIAFFIRKLKSYDDELCYRYCRYLARICKLYGDSKNIVFSKFPNEMEDIHEDEIPCYDRVYDDEYLDQLFENGDYDQLYSLYSLEEIENYSKKKRK